VVKVIRQQAASPSHVDGSILRAHWRHLANTIELLLSSAHQSSWSKRQINRFSCSSTAHGRMFLYLQRALFPKNCPFPWSDLNPCLTHGSLGWPEFSTQAASRSVQPFLHRQLQSPYTLQWDASCPTSKLPGSLGPPKSSTQMASQSVQPFLQGSLVWQTDRQTTLLSR